MKRIFNIFKVRPEERWIAIIMILILAVLNGTVVWHFYNILTPLYEKPYPVFIRNFVMSGFDPLTYYVLTDWHATYNVYRHPLLAFYMYIPYLINQGLIYVTGINCALFLATGMQVFCGFYAAIFLFRIFREIVGLRTHLSGLLTVFYFSFAYVMLSAMVPDHFIISMMLLLLALYVSGRRMMNKHPLKTWQTALYFILTAGTTLNNGLKIFLSGLFANGKRFFQPKYLLFAVILPSALLWGFARWEYRKFVWPEEMAKKAMKEKKKVEEKKAREIELAEAAKNMGKTKPNGAPKKAVKKKRISKQGTPFMQGEFMRWSDATTSRTQCLIENLFGEGIQLHQDHLLGDQMRSRPMIVHYRYAAQYVVEGIVVLLFLVGIWFGRRSKFFWLCMSYFALDMLLHIGLGFGITEVYIMTAHWMYIIPITIAFLLKNIQPVWNKGVTVLVALLTCYLLGYNGSLLLGYLC